MDGHFSFPLMNSFNITEAAISPMQLMLSEDFPLSQFVKGKLFGMKQLKDQSCLLYKCS